jgi:hypothetical protein
VEVEGSIGALTSWDKTILRGQDDDGKGGPEAMPDECGGADLVIGLLEGYRVVVTEVRGIGVGLTRLEVEAEGA